MPLIVTYDWYKTEYNGTANEEEFNQHVRMACKRLINETTGVCGTRKLIEYFPKNHYDADLVRECACRLVDISIAIQNAEKSAATASGYVQRNDGTVMPRMVSSVSSGSESISYATGANNATLFDKAFADKTVQKALYRDAITEYLSDVKDANGINLLYMGQYPKLK